MKVIYYIAEDGMLFGQALLDIQNPIRHSRSLEQLGQNLQETTKAVADTMVKNSGTITFEELSKHDFLKIFNDNFQNIVTQIINDTN